MLDEKKYCRKFIKVKGLELLPTLCTY